MSQPAADRPPLFARRRDARGRLRSGPPIWDRRTWKLLFSAAGAPALILAAVFGLALAAQTADGPAPWGISGQALAHGRWHTVAAHMVAHGNLAHLLMNLSVLLPLTPLAMVRLGSGRAGWGRFAALYAGSALAGAAMYLALNPGGPPMVGSSGAIFGLWGAVVRIGADGGMIPLRTRRIFDEVVLFVLLNLMMVGLVFVIVQMEGGVIGSVGWEAHLGGFLFGLLAMPRLAPRTPPPAHH
ncbi:rhomboid family intramembrane serine protease [Brevundimonas sp.]|uniref:rhomboid family intramembrane serine protease n=1 Tax=Brevundimonas sp. TaxID=1871086 RepID=UPI002FC5AB6E